MTDLFDELLGGPAAEPAPEPAKRRPGRPTREEQAARMLEQRVALTAAAAGKGLDDIGGVQALRRPVTINTLATVFQHDVQTITRRLIDCPHIVQSGRKLYDFKEACSYIVKPKMTPEQFVKTLNSAHMPAEINKVFWDAQRSRVKYKIEAQEAWETHEVAEGFGALCMTVKEALSTMTESMRERAKLTDEQAVLFDAGIEDLKERLAEKLGELAERMTATSMFDKPLFGAPSVETPGADVDLEDDEDDY